MASLKVGRILDWNALGNISELTVTSTDISVRGLINQPSDINKAKAVRDQLAGLANNPDEPFVPFRYEGDSTLDSVVRIKSASADLSLGALDLGQIPWSITADRVPNGSLPNVEAPLIGGFRTNSAGVAGPPGTVVPWHAVPYASLDYYDGASVFQSTPYLLESESGQVGFYAFIAGVGRKTARTSIPPANWYDGAAYVEQPYGSTYYKAQGRMLATGLSTTGWRIGNGIIRVAPGTSAGSLALQAWDSATKAWGATHTMTLFAYDGSSTYDVNRINSVSILRNSPEECRIRLGVGLVSVGVNYGHRTTLDIKLRRGSRFVECRWTTYGTSMLGGITEAASTGGTGFTGGVVSGGADAQGNLVAIFTPTFASLSTGPIQANSTGLGIRALAWSFGFGIVLAGASAAYPNRSTDLRDQYFAPYGERMTVVGW
jgi:hypothetical protein